MRVHDPMRQKINSDELNAIKGFLMIAVVMGHSQIGAQYPAMKNLLYCFHVQGFLFLAFILTRRMMSYRYLCDHVVRYLVPYTEAVLLCSLFYYQFMSPSEGAINIAAKIMKGLILGHPNALKDACGCQFFWFLPALLSLVILRAVYNSTGWLSRATILLLSIVVHVFASALRNQFTWFPWGILIALYLFPLCLIVSQLIDLLDRHNKLFQIILLLGVATLLGTVCIVGSSVRLGLLGMPSLSQPFLMILHDATAIVCFLVIVVFSAQLAKIRQLQFVGVSSLIVYLGHQPFLNALHNLLPSIGFQEQITRYATIAEIVSIVLVLIMLCMIDRLLSKLPRIRRFIIPRNLSDVKVHRQLTCA